jgi:glutamate N-acetyltransferase/amino-acid N-acetyltransferase
MERIATGGVLSAAGFLVGSAACGIKSNEGSPDICLLMSIGPATAAGTFTTNRFAAAPVRWSRELLPAEDVRAVIVNAGNANAFTGDQGQADVRTEAALVAELIGCKPHQVCVASTGIIGHPLSMDKVANGVRCAHEALSDRPDAARAAELAIMTTDTHPKACAVHSLMGGMPFHVGGMAKGSGMIAPDMATMLAFVTTDAGVPKRLLGECLRQAVDLTFNRITVDGDTSTNDSVIVLANGSSGAMVTEDGSGLESFREALGAVLAELAYQIVSDGEGATRVIRVRVEGAATQADAETAARAVAESQLFKCAVAGSDPNWGRIICSLGYSGAEVCSQNTTVHIGRTCVVLNGTPTGASAADQMVESEVHVTIDLGLGQAHSTMLSCDLTEEYVRINAQYHT